ncbi:ATP-dependent DNA helicase RRM3 [Cucumispora dikerogammari]|nr:ATP-dependent DNA helicase RRM3 [Cucumispora dikerogammari]
MYTFNTSQQTVFDLIIRTIHSCYSSLFFLDGLASSGKSYLLNRIILEVLNDDRSCIVVAPTGLAASLLINERTLHSQFKIPFKLKPGVALIIVPDSPLANSIRTSCLIIIDEFSMVDSNMLKLVDQACRSIAETNNYFGGKVVLFDGDPRHPPVVHTEDYPFSFTSCLFACSEYFRNSYKFSLIENMRAVGHMDHINFIQSIGDGSNLRNIEKFSSVVAIPNTYISCDLITDIYDHLNELSDEDLITRQILCLTNREVEDYNKSIIEKFSGDFVSLVGVNSLGGTPRGYVTNK